MYRELLCFSCSLSEVAEIHCRAKHGKPYENVICGYKSVDHTLSCQADVKPSTLHYAVIYFPSADVEICNMQYSMFTMFVTIDFYACLSQYWLISWSWLITRRPRGPGSVCVCLYVVRVYEQFGGIWAAVRWELNALLKGWDVLA